MSVVPKDSYVAVETKDSLPQDVHEIAVLRNEVIAWTSLDPEFARDIYLENKIRNQYWILTETELKVVTKDHDACCLPGCIKAGDSVQTIPLESITDCGSNDARYGCVNSCCKPLPMLYVDTASFVRKEGSQQHETMGYGLARRDWFIREVLNRRDIVKGNLLLNACEGAVVATPVMERGGCAMSAADRMKEITELHSSGVLTNEEFLEKRKDIIDSI